MNLNEILSKDKLTEEEYTFLKRNAYNFAATNSGKEIKYHIESLELNNKKETNALLVYFTTLTFPNDIDFINEYDSKNENRHNTTYLKEKFKMPEQVVQFKIYEITNFNTRKILSTNSELRKLAEQAPHFELKDKQTTR